MPDDAYKTVSAVANKAGGWLVFGVSEADGQLLVTGVEQPDKVQNDFLGALRRGQKLNRRIAVEPQRFENDGKHVFAFHVQESPRADKPVCLKADPRQSYIRRARGLGVSTPSGLSGSPMTWSGSNCCNGSARPCSRSAMRGANASPGRLGK